MWEFENEGQSFSSSSGHMAGHYTPSGPCSAVFRISWRRHWQVVAQYQPLIQSKSPKSTSGHQERCICQLSSPSTSFLPGIVQQPGFRRKTFWCSSYTPLIIYNSTAMLLRAAWDVALARVTARDKYFEATVSKKRSTDSCYSCQKPLVMCHTSL